MTQMIRRIVNKNLQNFAKNRLDKMIRNPEILIKTVGTLKICLNSIVFLEKFRETFKSIRVWGGLYNYKLIS